MAKPTAEAAQVVPAAGQVTSARPGPEATGPEATGPQRRAFGPTPAGQAELDAARASDRALVWTAAVFSAFMNLLMLTGPLFMLQVYDRVLGSRSEETLLSLFVLVSFLFTMMGLLDLARTRVMARIAARYQTRLDRRVFGAMLGRAALVPGDPDGSELLRRVLSDDPDEAIPPPETKKTLSARQRDVLKRWIAQGAEYQLHWSLIAPVRPAIPQVSQPAWVRNPIDAFVLAKLDALKLKPADEADRRTLARRVSLDLTGLPPSPADGSGRCS